MATSTKAERVYHQDYIARIRYSNVLPPPPNHPKLLNIPNTGLSSGQYTSAAYASRLAREQPLNIEADAELGMPIDLVGLPGVFDGDETCLMAPERLPSIHPADRALLKPLSALGKGTSSTASVSFLRRTEYISADQTRRADIKSPAAPATRKRKRPDTENENDPARILRDVVGGFDIANPQDASQDDNKIEDKQAWDKPEHPTKPSLRLVDSYPLLPDVPSVTDSFFNMIVKFSTNPGSASNQASNGYDTRIDTGVLRPLELDPKEVERYNISQALWEERREKRAPPKPYFTYEYFLPEDANAAALAKEKLDGPGLKNSVNGTNGHADGRDDSEAESTILFKHVRWWQAYQQSGDVDEPFGDSVALALYDPADAEGAGKQNKQKGAYFYPVGQRTFIRPKHTTAGAVVEDDKVDVLEITAREPNEEDEERRTQMRNSHFYGIEVAAEA